MDGNVWLKNEIIYHIFIDRFAGFKSTDNWDKPEFLGGNIKGIIQKIPYLKDLGITTIWISPFYKTSAYHGYHITDFYSVDAHFGCIEDLDMLISKVHDNKMKIIADFVPNHCSKHHPFFIEAQNNKKSKYYDWFYFTNWPDQYLCFLSISEIPKLNLNNKITKDHILNYMAKHGTKNKQIQEILYTKAVELAPTNEMEDIFKATHRILTKSWNDPEIASSNFEKMTKKLNALNEGKE